MITDETARGQRWLSPFIVFPNIGAAAVNAAVAAGAGLTLAASRAAARAGVPLADLAAGTAGRIATRATDALKASSDLVAGGIRAAAGQPAPVSAHALLSRTLIEEPLKASAWPILALLDAVGAATDTSPSMAAAATAPLSRALSYVSLPGVIPGEHGAVAAARTRAGFVVTAAGSAQAVFRSVRGIGGGLLALGVGDSAWIAQGLKDFLASAEHVHDKHANDGLERGAAPPVSQALAKISAEVIEQFPRRFVHAMEHEGLTRASREYAANRSAVNRMLALYLAFTVRMLYDVAAFVGKGLVDAPDAQKVALCELAIMESALADDERDAALAEVRRTASRAILEFEQHVPSIFDGATIAFAQSTSAEAYSLRAFLWLYRDEARARAANHRETSRKFGPETARRIAERPRYPIAPEEAGELTRGGPRPEPEVAAILDALLRERGLGAVAGAIKTRGPRPARARGIPTGGSRRAVRLVPKQAAR